MATNFSCLFSCDIVGMNMPDFDDKIGEKIRNDVTNKLLDELRDLMQRKWISSNKDTNFWMSSNIGLHYSNIEVQTADWICQNFLNIGEFLKAEMTQDKSCVKRYSFQNSTKKMTTSAHNLIIHKICTLLHFFHRRIIAELRSREYRFTHMNCSKVDIPLLSEALSGSRI